MGRLPLPLAALCAAALATACGAEPTEPPGGDPPSGFALTVQLAGGGGVTSDPAGIDCPGDCTEVFQPGTAVTLTASPAAGWHFAGWGSGCSGTAATCAVTMSAAGSVTATFGNQSVLSVSVAGGGTVTSSPAGIACPGDCAETFASGTVVRLQAAAAAGSRFTGWQTVPGCATQTSCDVALAGDRAVQAQFRREVTLTLSVRGDGTVSGTAGVCQGVPGGDPVECVHQYLEGDEVTLSATPQAGWQVAPWGDPESTGCAGTLGPTCVLALGGPGKVAVRFAPLRAVRVVYLVPSDRAERADYTAAVDSAARNLRIWLHGQLGTGRTISLAPGNRAPGMVVEVYHTSHPAAWYADGADPLRFWSSVLADGFALTGGQFNDPDNVWVFYVDADPACAHIVGGTSGVALMPANDLRGLVRAPNQPRCAGELPDDAPPCRWVGGAGHELGHALGLPHPPGCEAGTGECEFDALMWMGFRAYPGTFLTDTERTQLNASPFFSVQAVPPPMVCAASGLAARGAFPPTPLRCAALTP